MRRCTRLPLTVGVAATVTALAVGLGPVLIGPAVAAPRGTVAAVKPPKGRPASTRTLAVQAPPAGERAALALLPTSATRVVARLGSRHTRDFGMIGVTWVNRTGTGTMSVEVRVLRHGTWSRWSRLTVDADGPAGTRAGTEPLWVGTADGVAARVTSARGIAPRGVQVVLVDTGTDPAGTRGAAPTLTARAIGDPSPAYTPQPALITRAGWGARPNTRCDDPRQATHTLGVVFHHTAGSNRYRKSQSRAIVRGIQAYHMRGRGWCDIGYNFLVDKYGQIFEGRSGGVLAQIRGAHAGNTDVNTYGMGVSMMGNLDKVRPSTAMKNATVRLIGWRLGTNYLPATGSYAIDGHRLNRIAGHRDVRNSGIRPATATACPGRYGYAWLVARGGLRDRVATYLKNYSSPLKTKALELGPAVTGYLSIGEYRTTLGRRVVFANGDIYGKGSLGGRYVTGAVRTEYRVWGNERGALGFPSGDLVPASEQQASQTFEHGTIYQVAPTGGVATAYGLTTGVAAKYQELGGFTSLLGNPTSRAVTTGNVDTATFERGTISYDRTTQVATVDYS